MSFEMNPMVQPMLDKSKIVEVNFSEKGTFFYDV